MSIWDCSKFDFGTVTYRCFRIRKIQGTKTDSTKRILPVTKPECQ